LGEEEESSEGCREEAAAVPIAIAAAKETPKA